jgi:hypothetical protein
VLPFSYRINPWQPDVQSATEFWSWQGYFVESKDGKFNDPTLKVSMQIKLPPVAVFTPVKDNVFHTWI